MGRLSGRTQAAACALLLLLCILVSRPVAEIGINDDWSYIRTTQLFAETGHIFFNGWAAPVFGWQAWWGALFIKLFGFSFTAVRASMVPLAMAATFVMHRALVRLGSTDWNATIGTLTVMVSPLVLPLACTFHTDIPAFLCIVVSLYGCERALRAETQSRCLLWLAAASLAGDLGGVTRQIAWLASLTFVPATAWLLRRKVRGVVMFCAGMLVCTFACIYASLRWLYSHPHTVHEHVTRGPVGFSVSTSLQQVEKAVVSLPFYLFPLLVAFVPFFPYRRRRAWLAAGSIVALIALFYWRKAALHTAVAWLEPACGTVVSVYGTFAGAVLGGSGPVLLSARAQVLLTVLTLGAAVAWVVVVFESRRTAPDMRGGGQAGQHGVGLTAVEVGTLLVPFAVLYALALVPRAIFWFIQDRYFPPLFLVAAAGLILLFQRHVALQMPKLSALAAIAMATLGTAFLHDMFAAHRAELEAANEVIRAGVPRKDVAAGYQYDSWTQLLLTGYVTDYRMEKRQPGALAARVRDPHIRCQTDYLEMLPSLYPRYLLSYDRDICTGPSPFAPVHYRTWLGQPGTLYILSNGGPASTDAGPRD